MKLAMRAETDLTPYYKHVLLTRAWDLACWIEDWTGASSKFGGAR